LSDTAAAAGLANIIALQTVAAASAAVLATAVWVRGERITANEYARIALLIGAPVRVSLFHDGSVAV
jgi:hypothetical protein